MRISYVILLLCLLHSFSWGWSKDGHVIIAKITYNLITDKTKEKIDLLLKKPMNSGFTECTDPLSRFEYALFWPDLIRTLKDEGPSSPVDPAYSKYVHGRRYSSWHHYINIPYFPEGFREDIAITPLTGNIIDELYISMFTLNNADPKTAGIDCTEKLCWLGHLTGDIHAPLHCTAMYSKKYPKGDRGGNSIIISGNTYDNLHSFWDHAPEMAAKKMKMNNVKFAQYLEKQYPRSTFKAELEKIGFAEWAGESYIIAIHTAYAGLNLNSDNIILTEDYKKKVMTASERQITLAAYRLADMLNKIFDR